MLDDNIVDFVSGSIAGATSKVIEYPFDTIKTRLQAQNLVHPRYYGALDCILDTLRTEGIHGLYRGISAPMIAAAAENAALFGSFRVFEKLLCPYIELGTLRTALAGSGSGLAASFILTPIELVKSCIQVATLAGKPHISVLQHIRRILADGGARGMWLGQTGTAVREAGGSAAWFGTHHWLLEILGTSSTSAALIAGAGAGIAYNLSMFPIDTVKSRLTTASTIGYESHGYWHVARDIWTTCGVRGFYRGAGITAMRAAPSSAVIFYVQGIIHDRLISYQ